MLVVEKCTEKKQKLNYTFDQISEKSGIPISTVYAFFRETSQNPSFITVGAICKALGISLDAIIGIEDDEMSAEEIARVREESKQNEDKLRQTIQEHSQNILLHEVTIENNNEIIRRQDLRMKELNEINNKLSDRIEYQKRAITWLRILSGCLIAFSALCLVALIVLARSIASLS